MKQTTTLSVGIIISLVLFSIVSAYSTSTQNNFDIKLSPNNLNTTIRLPIQEPITIPVNPQNLTFRINSTLNENIIRLNSTIKESNQTLLINLTYNPDTPKINFTPIYESPKNITLDTSVPTKEITFFPGDANNDGQVDISDAVYISMFMTGEKQVTSLIQIAQMDANQDSKVTLEDSKYLLNYLFNNGPSPRKSKIILTPVILLPKPRREHTYRPILNS